MMSTFSRTSCKPFYFARHGKTYWNERQLCQGQEDVPLNDAGKEEARRLSDLASKIPFTQIFSSPLIRALETAQIIHQKLPCCSLIILDEWKERKWGFLEGAPSQQMYAVEEQEENDPLFVPGNGIEPRGTFRNRILQGLSKSLQNQSLPLIISHGRCFLLMCELLGIPLVRQVPNASLVRFALSTNQQWTMDYEI